MITRRSFIASLAASLAALISWRPAWAQGVNRTRVTFVLTNDIYLMGETKFPDGSARGGFARLAAVVKGERVKGGHVLVVHGGDTLSPSLMSGFDLGEHIITLTNLIGPDIFVPGNHEFDFGKAVFLKRMAEAKFPLYAANLRDAGGAALPGFKDRAMLEFDGVRIGLTGMAYDKSARVSSPEDLQFTSTVEATKAEAARLRQEGADFVLGVLHADRGDSLALQFARAADFLLTGHTHDLFINFDGISGIVESSFDAHYVTAIDIDIGVRESNGRRTARWWPRFRVIDTADVEPDPEIASIVANLERESERQLDVVIGSTAVALDSRNTTVRTSESAIGNLFADAMRVLTNANAAVINGGGIRANKIYPPGTGITRRDILAELPFNNRVVVIDISGLELRRALENGLSQLPAPGGRFPQVSGLKLEYALARPAGARIISIEIDRAPLDDAKMYRVAILDFLARGGDNYTQFRDAKRITPDNDAPLLANEVMTYIRRLGTVRTEIEGRIVAR